MMSHCPQRRVDGKINILNKVKTILKIIIKAIINRDSREYQLTSKICLFLLYTVIVNFMFLTP